MRLDKYLAEGCLGQRKAVRKLIEEGNIYVNDEVVLDATFEVDEETDRIVYQGEIIPHPGKRYIMFHKPRGCITARKDEQHKTVLDYFEESERALLFPVGRLDKDTEGLLLLTNDGEFDYQLMNPIHEKEKTYYFWALGTIDEESKRTIEEGCCIYEDNRCTKPAKLELDKVGFYDEYAELIDGKPVIRKENEYRKPVVSGYLTITEGKKHQVKRMLRAVGCYVIYLKRISIGALKLDERLAPGEYRNLTSEEIKFALSESKEF